MATINEIKNLALFELGFPDSIDFTDLTIPTVQKVNRIYPTTKEFVLSNYYWRFVEKRVQLINPIEETDTVVIDDVGDVITVTKANFGDNLEVSFTTTGTLPTPLIAGTTYFTVNSNGLNAQLSSTLGGIPIDFTDTGTGVQTIVYNAVAVSPYRYLFLVPSDLLVLRNAYLDKQNWSPIGDFELNNTGYFTDDKNGNSQGIFMWYASRIDETLFPPYFVNYFQYKLALDLCFNLTGDTDLIQLLAAQEAKMLKYARNVDAKQVKSRTIKSSPFTQIRGRGASGI